MGILNAPAVKPDMDRLHAIKKQTNPYVNPNRVPYVPQAASTSAPVTPVTPIANTAPAQQGLDNPYIDWLANSLRQSSGDYLGQQLAGIRSNAVGVGGVGGARQGLAEGQAIGQNAMGLNNTLANLYSGQFNTDRNYGLQNDALDLNVYNSNQNWMRTGQQDQLALMDRLLGWNQQYGIGNATTAQNTPMNYYQQFANTGAQLGGLGGSSTQNMQGNPYLGAIGGWMLGQKMFGS